jgi:pyridinium-3,5-biscarboxylic acid mononucleotide sulfurtransferase
MTLPTGSQPPASDAALRKEQRLVAWLERAGSVLVGFSGGVDSAYLACVATATLGPGRTLAVIGRSASYPAEQWAAARRVADDFGIMVLEVVTEEMQDPRYAANPSNRCYFCKSELWSRLLPVARERGFSVVVDGTNADDLGDHRPGMQAARESEVASPLAEVGLTKQEIRELSRARGLPTWSQPSSPCLSSRLPYGTAVTIERLAQVERAEGALRALGVTGDLRVRHHQDMARVELHPAELERWLEPARFAQLSDAVRFEGGFDRVSVDLRGFRSGSLNILTGVRAETGDDTSRAAGESAA